ncbi:MAG: hypothetical protein GY932_15700 [Arcobacter sp.]|nr:hypothetical protein [Arcobacter sp.]
MPYLTKNYNFTYKPIYMIRHPFAVVSSQLSYGAWDFEFRKYEIPNVPFNEIYKIHKDFLSSLKTKEEALTATWCISNQITLHNSNNNINWITMNYEELLINPKDSINRILNEWNIDYDINNIEFHKKSTTAISGSPISGKDQIKYWQKNLDKNQIARMKDVLIYFNLKEYSEKPEPLFIYK